MHGVGDALAGLPDFVGSRLLALDDLENIVYFRFENPAGRELQIGVESEWVLRADDGGIVAAGNPRPSISIDASLLLAVVSRAATRPPDAIELYFSSGHILTIVDNSDQYESFSIPHASVYI